MRFFNLLKVDWMDNITRSKAQMKLSYMISVIGYPDELLNDDKLNDYYTGLPVNPRNLLETVLNFNKFDLNGAIRNLKRRISNADWTGASTDKKFIVKISTTTKDDT